MPDFQQSNAWTPYDYYIFIDYADSDKIKARSGRTGTIFSTHLTNADVVIQACLDRLTSGGSIFLGVGIFDIYSQVNSNHNVDVVGSGREKTILRRQLTTTNQTFILSGDNITIRSLTFDGNYPTNTSSKTAEIAFGTANLLSMVLCMDVAFKNWVFMAIGNYGYAVIQDCIFIGTNPYVTNISQYGIWSNISTAHTRVVNCNMQYCTVNAIFGGGITIVEDCYFANNALVSGGQVAAGSNCTLTRVTDCTFEKGLGSDSGIEMDTHEWVVIGNKINKMNHWGIVTNASIVTRAVVANNVVTSCGQGGAFAGIFINGAQTNFLIQGNICIDDQDIPTQKYGIQIASAASDHYIITNNICRGNVTTQILDQGSGVNKHVSNNVTT
jgi:hypothetical protein